MIPISLSIKGMYSYRETQNIDFAALTKNHLFGIFGPVGSGKSTILEAMSYALYGETERLNAKDSRNYNMMNLKSREIEIEFVFKSGMTNQDLYMFKVKGVRDKKDFEKIPKLDRRAYKHDGTRWIPLDSNDGEGIIGLSYDNFRRTIIIPQGRFQEFLQLGGNDRTTMMKEIFSLSRYDLARQVASVETDTTSELDRIKGQLMPLDTIDEASMQQDEKERDGYIALRKEREQTLASDEHREREMAHAKMVLARVELSREYLAELDRQSPEVEEREKAVALYERCHQYFPDLIGQRNDTERDLHDSEAKLAQKSKQLEDVRIALEREEPRFEKVRVEYDNRHDLQVHWEELESIGTILEIDSQLESQRVEFAGCDRGVKDQIDRIGSLQGEIGSLAEELKKAKKGLPDERVLHEIKRWSEMRQVILGQIDESSDAVAEHRATVDDAEGRKQDVIRKPPVVAHTTPEQRELPVGEILVSIQTALAGCHEGSAAVQDEIDALREMEVLERFSSELKEGDPCPLCGSEHHPHKYAAKGYKARIDALVKQKKGLEKDEKALQEVVEELIKLRADAEAAEKASANCNADLEARRSALVQHEAKYKWTILAMADVEQVDGELERTGAVRQRIVDLDSIIDGFRREVESASQRLEELKEKRQRVQDGVLAAGVKRRERAAALRSQIAHTIGQWTSTMIEQEVARLKAASAELEKSYKSLERDIRAWQSQRGTLEGAIKAGEEEQTGIQERLSRVENELAQRMKTAGFSSLSEIEAILSRQVDISDEKRFIRTHQEKVAAARHELSIAEKEASAAIYDTGGHATLQSAIADSKQELSLLDQEIGRLGSRVVALRQSVETKRRLDAERERLEIRIADLKKLRELFREQGFVNYASSVYLQNICGLANVRFMQLTRQQLRLELSDKNSFQVRDFMNDGQVRSVKTLSGGQMFQASLCLALALADSLQQVAHTNENFFFLDEGFGSLDKESLQIVFDALKSLRKENKIVGVISHVEEMQQEIDNYVSVRLDPNRGSLLQMN